MGAIVKYRVYFNFVGQSDADRGSESSSQNRDALCTRLSDAPHSINSENLPCKLPAQ
jgi:hypothetical protein